MIDPKLKDKLDAMSQEELCHKWRFAPAGDPMFLGETGDYFKHRLGELGGMTSEISKK